MGIGKRKPEIPVACVRDSVVLTSRQATTTTKRPIGGPLRDAYKRLPSRRERWARGGKFRLAREVVLAALTRTWHLPFSMTCTSLAHILYTVSPRKLS